MYLSILHRTKIGLLLLIGLLIGVDNGWILSASTALIFFFNIMCSKGVQKKLKEVLAIFQSSLMSPFIFLILSDLVLPPQPMTQYVIKLWMSDEKKRDRIVQSIWNLPIVLRKNHLVYLFKVSDGLRLPFMLILNIYAKIFVRKDPFNFLIFNN